MLELGLKSFWCSEIQAAKIQQSFRFGNDLQFKLV